MLKGIIESLLFVSDEPLSLAKLQQITGQGQTEIGAALEEIKVEMEDSGRGIVLKEVAGGFKLFTNPKYASYVERLVLSSDFRRLTQAALETLAVVAYKQPITRLEISNIRGVSVDSVLANLLAKGLVKEIGKDDSPGHPMLYGTSDLFLESFGLKDLNELPPLEEFSPDDETSRKIHKHLQS